jgi:hypothetical protein
MAMMENLKILASAIIRDAHEYALTHPAEYAAFLAERRKEVMPDRNAPSNNITVKGPRCGQKKEVG